MRKLSATAVLIFATAVAWAQTDTAPRTPTIQERRAAVESRVAAARAALVKEPESEPAMRALAILHVEQAYLMQTRAEFQAAIKAAEDAYAPALKKAPKDVDRLIMMSTIYVRGQRQAEVEPLWKEAIEDSDKAAALAAKFGLGRFMRSVGNHERAVPLLEEASKSPTAAGNKALYELADEYFSLERWPDAITAYREIMEREKRRDIAVLRRLAESVANTKQYDEAIKLLDEAEAAEPGQAETRNLRGFVLLQKGEFDGAAGEFNKVLEKDPKNVTALHYRAFAAFQRGQYKPAETDLVAVMQLTRKPESVLLLARTYRAMGQPGEAAKVYDYAVQVMPTRAMETAAVREMLDYLTEVAATLKDLPVGASGAFATSLRAAHPLERKRALLTRMWNSYREDSQWPTQLAQEFRTIGQPDEALKVLASARQTARPAAPLLSAIVLLYVQRNEPRAAEEPMAALVKEEPNHPVTLTTRALWNEAMRQDAEARKDIAAAIERSDITGIWARLTELKTLRRAATMDEVIAEQIKANPTSARWRMALAARMQAAGNMPAAEAEAARALELEELDAKKDPTGRIRALRVLGDACFAQKKWAEAVATYKRILDIDAKDIDANNNVAYLLAENLNKADEAVAYADRAIAGLSQARIPMNGRANILDTAGWVLFRKGDYKAAVARLEESLRATPLPAAHYHLAATYEKIGNKDASVHHASETIRLGEATNDPSVKDARELIKRARGEE